MLSWIRDGQPWSHALLLEGDAGGGGVNVKGSDQAAGKRVRRKQ